MRILLTNVVDGGQPVHTRYYPLSFGYLVSYAEKHGCKFDYRYLETTDDSNFHDVLTNWKPDVVGMTAITENYNRADRLACFIKRNSPHTKVVIGGIHISSVPESLSSAMDVGIVGEGEQTFVELFRSNFQPDSKIKGLVYWHDPQDTVESYTVQTEERELIEPLDLIPHPRRDIFSSYGYREPYIFTSRGCAYRCSFCSSSRYWKKLRFHSAKYIAEEVSYLYWTKTNHINIYDDCFPLDMNRMEQVKDMVKHLPVTFSLSVRANLVTDHMAEVMKEMHVTKVGIGIESHSQRILDWLQKGNTVDDNQRAVSILKEHDIHVHASFIRDVPIETKEDLKLTYDFIKRNKLSFDMYRLMRFPNTPIYDGSDDWDACKVKYYKRHILRRMASFAYRQVKKL